MGKKSTKKFRYYSKKKATKQLMREYEMGLINEDEFSEGMNILWGV